MAYDVIIAPKAAQEIADALTWYADISSEIARKWHSEMVLHIASLKEHPERCPPIPVESKKMKKNIRQLLHGDKHGQYRILFEIKGQAVNIVSVRHSSRWRDLP